MRYVKYTINELMNITEADFVSALFEHTENRRVAEATHDDEAKIESWRDCLEFLKRQFASRDLSIMGEVAFCFEYKIFDGTWIDAVIVCENKIILLEFKSGTNTDANILDGHRSQINGYYNKVASCNKVIWEERNNNPLFSVERFLTYSPI